jgi:hypothetical protein
MNPRPDVSYPVLSKHDHAPFFDSVTNEPWHATLLAQTADYNRYDIGNATYASFDSLRQAWVV